MATKLPVAAIFCFFVPCLSVAPGDEPVDPWTYWTSDTTALWGANIYQGAAPNSKDWQPLLRRHDFEDLQRTGANYVNLSVPGPFEPVSGNFNADYWTHLTDCVKWAKDANLKIVIGFRTAPGRNEADITCPFGPDVIRSLLDDPASPHVAKYIEMWQTVAKAYGNDPDVIGFDLLVEPHAPKAWAAGHYNDYEFRKSNKWRQLAEKTIKAIRDQKIQTPILVEPDLWAGAVYLNQTDEAPPMAPPLHWIMPDGDRLVCAVHQYAPSDYAESGTQGFDIDFADLQQAFTEIKTWRGKNPQVPVCVNEFGVKQSVPYAELFLRKELELLTDQNLNHAVWLWEVTDPQVDYHDFDVRYNPAVYAELLSNWQANAGSGKSFAERARKAGQPKRNVQPATPNRHIPRFRHPGPRVRGTRLQTAPAAPCGGCDSKIHDPALNREFPVMDAQDEFRRLSEESPENQRAVQVFADRKTVQRTRDKSQTASDELCSPLPPPNSVPAGPSRSIGFWPKTDQLTFSQSTAIRHVIVFPDEVGGDFSSFLYQTSTNRSRMGTEAHIAFSTDAEKNPIPPTFRIFDWSFCPGVQARDVPISKMNKWVFPVTVNGIALKGVLVINQTRLVNDVCWINCVYLGVFENGTLQRFDNVYSHTYVVGANENQQPDNNYGFWGPEIESFQNYCRKINPMGFQDCWMIQDGNSRPLNAINTCLHNDNFGPAIFYEKPSRDFLVH